MAITEGVGDVVRDYTDGGSSPTALNRTPTIDMRNPNGGNLKIQFTQK